MDDKEFYRQYDAYEREALRETIAYLIEQRQKMRDKHIQRLELIIYRLFKRIRAIRKQQLIEELRCFKDTLALHRLLKNA